MLQLEKKIIEVWDEVQYFSLVLLIPLLYSQCRINNSSKCSNRYGPRVFGASRSSAINLIYYIAYMILFNLRNQYFTKFAVSVSKDFQLKSVCVQKVFFDSFLYSYVTKDIRLRSAVLPF